MDHRIGMDFYGVAHEHYFLFVVPTPKTWSWLTLLPFASSSKATALRRCLLQWAVAALLRHYRPHPLSRVGIPACVLSQCWGTGRVRRWRAWIGLAAPGPCRCLRCRSSLRLPSSSSYPACCRSAGGLVLVDVGGPGSVPRVPPAVPSSPRSREAERVNRTDFATRICMLTLYGTKSRHTFDYL